MSVNKSWTVRAVAAAAVATLLVGCFGGGGGGGDDGGGSESASVGVRVIDGAIRNALVCLDTNLNGACDAGEPSARTNAAGDATLSVAPADAGRFPVLAMVGTDAVDADHGPVTVPFVMKAPADQPAVVSPLTTLVQNTIEQTGTTTQQAAATLQSQLGMNVSVMQDYTQTTSTVEGGTLAAVARMVVVTQQQQTTSLSGAVGTSALDGTVISQADIDQLIARKVAELLPTLVAALADPEVQAAIVANNPTALNTALQPLASGIVAERGVSAESVSTLVAVNNQAAAPQAAPEPGALLHTLNFSNAQNWFRRVITTTAAQLVPDANGLTRFSDNRARSNTSVIATWNMGGEPAGQSDLHWNGSAWVNCGPQHQNSDRRESGGRSNYNYCDGYEVGANSRASFDIAGQSMAAVYDQIRAAGYTNITIQNAASVLGSTAFPANSRIVYVNGTPTSTAVAYLPRPSQVVRIYSSDALAQANASDCGAITASLPIGQYSQEATSLEQMVARLPGKACAYAVHNITGLNGAQLSSGPRNEAWGFASVSLGTLGNASLFASPSVATTFFTSNQLLRVAFGPDNTAKFYSCKQRSWDGSTRNCDPIGTGTYAISTMGDARVMTFQNLPPLAASLGQDRVFVERGGKVYYGYKNKLTPISQARFNTDAGNALLSRLNIATVSPTSTVSLTPASYQGDWILWPTATPEGYLSDQAAIIRLNPTYTGAGDLPTTFGCFDAHAAGPTSPFPCTVTLDAGSGALTFAESTPQGPTSAAITLDFMGGTTSGVFTEADGTQIPISIRRR